MGCIYKFTNKLNRKSYIGKTENDVITRYNAHKSGNGNMPLKHDIDKHGISNFDFEILHDGIPNNLLDDHETGAIKKYNSLAPNRYNLTTGGSKNYSVSKETYQKLLKAMERRLANQQELQMSQSEIRVGDSLKILLAKKGITQYRMAVDLGISHASASKLVNNKRTPNVQTIVKLADYFGKTTDEILGRK